jgi:hypothetical protein
LHADLSGTTLHYNPAHGRHRARADRLRVDSACCDVTAIDGKKYLMPGDVKPPEGGTERRHQRATRAALRTLVRWAQQCASAEQLGKKLSRRYQRQQQR